MNKAYCILHITPYKGLTRIGAHIDRLQVPKNADASRTHLNEERAPKAKASLTADVQTRIEEGYTATRKIRDDARLALGMIMTGSHERMKEIEKDAPLFEDWKQANFHFASQHFDKENIVRFTLHRDERTPHIHCVFVPITADGRLSAKDFIGGKEYGAGKEKLRKYQDTYAQAMKEFGLARGLPVERTQARHLTTAQYYRAMSALKEEVKEQVAPIKPRNVFRLQEVREDVERTLLQTHRRAMEHQTRQERLTRDYHKELEGKLERVKKEVNLVQHLASMGYQVNKGASNDKEISLQKGKETLLVSIHRDEKGHWTYRSAKDPQDKGTIVELMQRRGHGLHAISNLSSKHLDQGVLQDLPKGKEKAQGKDAGQEQGHASLVPPGGDEQAMDQRKKKKKKKVNLTMDP